MSENNNHTGTNESEVLELPYADENGIPDLMNFFRANKAEWQRRLENETDDDPPPIRRPYAAE